MATTSGSSSTAAAASQAAAELLGLDLTSAPGSGGQPDRLSLIEAASSVEIYASIIDRYSVKGLSRGSDRRRRKISFAIGASRRLRPREDVTSPRAFASHELASGKGEWEADLSYFGGERHERQHGRHQLRGPPSREACYGASTNGVISLGGTLYYRLTRDVFMIASAYLQRTSISVDGGARPAPMRRSMALYRLLPDRVSFLAHDGEDLRER